jgi:hypothetical protein
MLRTHAHAGSTPRSRNRTTAGGKDALPPAKLTMATLVQGYLGMSDAEMVELTVVDLRVQMVLGCLGGGGAGVLPRRLAGIARAADWCRDGPRPRSS